MEQQIVREDIKPKFRDTSLLLQKVILFYSSYIKLQTLTTLFVIEYKNPRTVFSPKWFSSLWGLSYDPIIPTGITCMDSVCLVKSCR